MEITHNNVPEVLGMLLLEVQCLRAEVTRLQPVKEEEPICGLEGIGKILNCGITHASRVKNSGYVDAAIYHVGRKMIIRKDLFLQLYKENEFKIKAKIKKSLKS